MQTTCTLKTVLLTMLAFALVVAAIYFEAPFGERVFDDGPLLGFSCNDTISAFSLDSACGYRPVRHLSFAISGTLWGIDHDVAHHLVNMGLHIVAATVVFVLLRLLVGHDRWFLALCGALLFLVHPAQVDAVAYISGRRDILCGLFYISAFSLFVWYRSAPTEKRSPLILLAAVLVWVLALGSKEMAVTLPAVILWYEITVHAPKSLQAPTFVARLRLILTRQWKFFLPLFAGAAAFVVYRGVLDSKSFLVLQGEWWGGTWWTNLMTGVTLQRYFAELAVVPLRLPGDWSPPMVTPCESTADARLWLGALILALLLSSIAFALKHQRNLVAFGLGWYLLALLPVSQIIPHHELFAEHYLYIPLVGLLIAGASGLSGCYARQTSRVRRIAAVALVIVIGLYGLRAQQHVGDYRNSFTLAHATLRWSPNHARAQLRAGSWLVRQKRWDDAEPYLISVLENPLASDKLRQTAYEMLGFHYLSERKGAKFTTIAERAFQNYPNQPTFKGMKGILLMQQGQTHSGLTMLTEAARHRSSTADLNFLAAMQWRKRGDIERAIELLNLGVRKDTSQPRLALALAHLLHRRDPQRSMRLVREVLSEDPAHPGARQLMRLLQSAKE